LVDIGPICFADDGYYFSSSKSKTEAIAELQSKLKNAIGWLTDSGMKVNVIKTEFAVFHKSLNTAGRIKIGTEWINAKQEMGVLGIIFNNRLE